MRRLIAGFGLIFALVAFTAPAFAQADAAQVPTTVPEMWKAWCARCHGEDGRGNVKEPTVTIRPIDFTECSVTSGEADPDWAGVITKGGHASGLSDQMPAFGEALKPDTIDGFVKYLRGLCTERGWPDGNLNLPRPIFTEKAFPEDELVLAPVASHVKGEPTEWSLATIFEKRISKRFQLELLGPVSSVSLNGERQTGYSDTEIGLKTVLNPNAKNHLATFGFDFVMPTGDADRGLSEGAGFEPYIATASAWGTSYLQTQFKLELPKTNTWDDKVGVYRIYVGHDLNVAPTGWTVGLELVGENDEVALAPQIRKGLSKTGAIAGGIGVSLPLNKRDEQHVQVVGFLLWEYLERPYFSRGSR
jgi:mono/diheme cytochrome c family protein